MPVRITKRAKANASLKPNDALTAAEGGEP